MDDFKISHKSLKKVKSMDDNSVVVLINGHQEIINLNELREINNEILFLSKMRESVLLNKMLKINENFYHDELKENIKKYLIGKEKIDLDKDYEDTLTDDNHVPFMKLKKIYESFEYFNLVDASGNVLIKSLDELIEPDIE